MREPKSPAEDSAASGAGEAFWAFALGFYAEPGVEAACLALQDAFGLEVMPVLYALWAPALDEASAARLRAAIAPVVPELRRLRAERRQSKVEGLPEPARTALKQRELAMERRLADLMVAAGPAGGMPDREGNLARLCGPWPPEAEPHIALLLTRARRSDQA